MAISPYVSVPDTSHYWLHNARLPFALIDETVPHTQVIADLAAPPFAENLVAADVEIRAGRINAIAPVGSAPQAATTVNVNNGLVFPCFVDIHTHLDKGQTWNRAANPTGTFKDALQAIRGDAHHWQPEDLYRRMDFGLRCSYVHGTKAIRTHFDAFGSMAETALAIIHQLRQEWAGRMLLQAVCLVSLDYYLTPEGEKLADRVAEAGAILGGVAYPNPELSDQLDCLFRLADERLLAIDLHVDETLDPSSICLRHVAKTKIQRGFTSPVVCGHCCSLSTQSPAEAEDTMKWVKEAAIGIVSLPMCNLYLQDRQSAYTPRYRGVTILQELKQRGIPVSVASDNCRDPFFAYGDHDGWEVLTQSVRIGHLDRPIADWPQAVTRTPADLMGLTDAGRLGLQQPADLVVFKARTFNELLCRPQSDRLVLRQGKAIETTLPDYAELDDLVGLS
ncbi:MAG: cytosine deaminase [Cyanobacteria bacterium P01_H01_bin.58]